MRYTRRALLSLLFVPLIERAANLPCDVRRLLGRRSNGSNIFHERHYRIHASVLLFGASIFSRQDVGGSWFTIEEAGQPDNASVTIRFAAGSWPARTRGLNRFGVMEEAVSERGATVLESAYLGFMTGSNEADLSQARKALAPAAGEIPCTLGHGYSSPGHVRCGLTRFTVPAQSTWKEGVGILEKQHGLLQGEPPESAMLAGVPYQTFFYSVRRALSIDAPQSRSRFLHNSKLEELETTKQMENGGTWKLTGTIRDEEGKKRSAFTVWYRKDDASLLPLKFEFRPRTFLRLTFEQEVKNLA